MKDLVLPGATIQVYYRQTGTCAVPAGLFARTGPD